MAQMWARARQREPEANVGGLHRALAIRRSVAGTAKQPIDPRPDGAVAVRAQEVNPRRGVDQDHR